MILRDSVLWICSILLVLGMGYVLTKFNKRISKEIESVENDEYRNALKTLQQIGERVVGALNQTVVDDLKEKGEFNKQRQIEVLNQAKKRVSESLDASSKEILEKHVGGLSKQVEEEIERQVDLTKGDKKWYNSSGSMRATPSKPPLLLPGLIALVIFFILSKNNSKVTKIGIQTYG